MVSPLVIGGEVVKEIVERYISRVKEKYGITGAMVTGSYVSGDMGPNSDIDIFFIWPNNFEAKRGREFFEGVEFEYFLSPEWKYYDRLRTDHIAMKIYATSKILYDPEGRLERIRQAAEQQIEKYVSSVDEKRIPDIVFWLETIRKDGEDLWQQGRHADFLYFTGSQLTAMSDLLSKIHNTFPVYGKYGVRELSLINESYAGSIENFLMSKVDAPAKVAGWISLCEYLARELGDVDITEYSQVSKL